MSFGRFVGFGWFVRFCSEGAWGAWGEWYYTQNYGNLGNMSASDWANRKAIVDKELAVLPASRMLPPACGTPASCR